MPELPNETRRPTVSVVLPTYNRAGFLPQTFKSIDAQTFRDWELIWVDDGSTDDTQDLIRTLAGSGGQSVRYVYQCNQGPGRARNAGLRLVRGTYVAFCDSDDLWLPHHLADSVAALEANPDVAWVFAATQVMSLPDGIVQARSSFYDGDKPLPLLTMKSQRRGALAVLDDLLAVEIALDRAVGVPLQTSVFRAEVFQQISIPEYRIGEDQVFLVWALKRGLRVGYLDEVHAIYHRHPGNTCFGSKKTLDARLELMTEFVRAFEELDSKVELSPSETKTLKRRLSREYFWHAGYPFVEAGRYHQALPMLRKGLVLAPGNLQLWKTYVATWVRRWLAEKTSEGSSQLRGNKCR
jgi:Glycosyl transferase family 2